MTPIVFGKFPHWVKIDVGKKVGTRFNLRMKIGIISSIAHRAVFLFVLLAVTLLSVGHRHNAVAQPLDASTAAYLAAGGKLEDLCTIDGETEGNLGAHCPVCLLGQDFALPGPEIQVGAVFSDINDHVFGRTHGLSSGYAFDFSRSSRAPPFV
jgi:hypothetical protein